MKKLLFTVLLAATALPFAACAVEVDGVTATVGKTSILRSEVYAAMARNRETSAARYNDYRDELIERALILKAAEDAKVSMQDWVVKDRMRTLINENFGGDRNKLLKALADDRMTVADWERRTKENLVIDAMRWNSVYKNVRVSPAEMRAEYEAHPERYGTKPKVTVSVILLKPEDKDKRTAVTDLIKAESFAAAAKKFSADTHAAEGGVWKDVNPNEVFKTAVCDEIAKMPKGTVSQWVEIDGWSFLLRKDDEAASAPRRFADAYDDIEAHVREANAKRLHDAWIKRLKDDAHIRLY